MNDNLRTMSTMAITAADVNKLRQITGAGMMDCKQALTEANGDFDLAVDVLRKKGQKVAAKRADRDATEGLVIAKTSADGTRGVLVCVNCETDFVAKNADFAAMADRMAAIALEKNLNSVEAMKAAAYDSNGLTIAEKLIAYGSASVVLHALGRHFGLLPAGAGVLAADPPHGQRGI